MKFSEVETAGKKYPVHWGMASLMRFCENEGIELAELQSAKPTAMLRLFYFGLEAGHRRAGVQLQLTQQDFEDLIDDDASFFQALSDAFAASMPQDDGKPGNALRPDKGKK